jgi:hypothetical protein
MTDPCGCYIVARSRDEYIKPIRPKKEVQFALDGNRCEEIISVTIAKLAPEIY